MSSVCIRSLRLDRRLQHVLRLLQKVAKYIPKVLSVTWSTRPILDGHHGCPRQAKESHMRVSNRSVGQFSPIHRRFLRCSSSAKSKKYGQTDGDTYSAE